MGGCRNLSWVLRTNSGSLGKRSCYGRISESQKKPQSQFSDINARESLSSKLKLRPQTSSTPTQRVKRECSLSSEKDKLLQRENVTSKGYTSCCLGIG